MRGSESSPLLSGIAGRPKRLAWSVVAGGGLVAACCLAVSVLGTRSSSSLLQPSTERQLDQARRLWATGSGLRFEGQHDMLRARDLAMAILTESANATVGTGATDVTGLTEEKSPLMEPTGTDAADATNGTAATDATELTGPVKEGPLSTKPSKQEIEEAMDLLRLKNRGVNVDGWPFTYKIVHHRHAYKDSGEAEPYTKPNPHKSKKLVDAGVNVGRWWTNDVDYGEGRESEDEQEEAAAEEEEEEAAESDTNSTSSGVVADAKAAGEEAHATSAVEDAGDKKPETQKSENQKRADDAKEKSPQDKLRRLGLNVNGFFTGTPKKLKKHKNLENVENFKA